MPLRGHPTAPKFDGTPRALPRFLETVNRLGNNAGITTEEIIKYTIRYAEIGDAELWEELTEAKGADWAAYEKAVLALYPGASDARRYAVADLERLAATQASMGVRDRMELGAYHREFLRIATYLLKNKKGIGAGPRSHLHARI